MNLSNKLRFKIEYKKAKKIIEINPKVVGICEIKEYEIGVIKKRPFYIHFDGKVWNILMWSKDKLIAQRLEPSE